MYFFTHLYMAKILFDHFSQEVELDKSAFSYGNIKPDLPSRNRVYHTMENCLDIVCHKAERILEKEILPEEFSVILGEICHYVCDFCCYHHLNNELHNENYKHFVYEMKLHKKLKKAHYKVIPSMRLPRQDIKSIVSDMREIYSSTSQSMQKDIDLAFKSSVWVCESIIYFMRGVFEEDNDTIIGYDPFLIKEGGNL